MNINTPSQLTLRGYIETIFSCRIAITQHKARSWTTQAMCSFNLYASDTDYYDEQNNTNQGDKGKHRRFALNFDDDVVKSSSQFSPNRIWLMIVEVRFLLETSSSIIGLNVRTDQ